MGCALKVDTKIDDRSFSFFTDYYHSTEYCEGECEIYNDFNNGVIDDNSPFCICMNRCTGGDADGLSIQTSEKNGNQKFMYINRIETDTTYCNN